MDLFYEYVNELEEQYQTIKKEFKGFILKNQYLFTTGADFEEIKSVLSISSIFKEHQSFPYANSFDLICKEIFSQLIKRIKEVKNKLILLYY